ncbi:MAG: nucleoside deaminase [Erysipelotrichales bacterium]|nr:MAG: nucleoside deaminase [Erysipelotrichales bacterium]
MHVEFMREAIKEALKALELNEVPIGAVVVKDNEIIAYAHNLRQTNQIATAHAEILAIEQACKKLGSWRLDGCSLYVTLEPCPLCAGAVIQSRIDTVIFGAFDPKGGSFGSSIDLTTVKAFNHHPVIYGGILEDECAILLKNLFTQKRDKDLAI